LRKTALLTLPIILLLSLSAAQRLYLSSGGVKTIIIDAGHGGKDPGNLGTRRYQTAEKDIALAVALKLGGYIKEHMPQVKVVYTRATDVFIPLKQRAEIANKAEGDLFISIHCDSFTKSSVHGTTSLVLGRNHDDENRVAIQENSAILLEDNFEEKYEGFDPRRPESLIALNLYQNTYLNQSVMLAKKIQDQFRTRVSRRDRGVKQQPLYVTSRTAMPAVLVELGFLTNPSEEDFLLSDRGQSYMASAIFRAIRDYKAEQTAILKMQGPKAAPKNLKPVEPAELKTEVKAKTEEQLKGKTVGTAKPQTSPKAFTDSARQAAPAGGPINSQVGLGVQILTSGQQKELVPQNFKGVSGVKVLEQNGLYKYYVGPVSTLAEARALQSQMKRKGHADSFIIGFKDNTKISATEALKMLK
jgi:N-acetylmuramoyl-L-alanine amidase